MMIYQYYDDGDDDNDNDDDVDDDTDLRQFQHHFSHTGMLSEWLCTREHCLPLKATLVVRIDRKIFPPLSNFLVCFRVH